MREFDYDALNRLIEERWLDGQTTVNTINSTYDAASRITDISDAFATYAYSYDNLGRVTSLDSDGTPDVPNLVLAAGYDANGRRASLAATIATVDDFVNDYTRDNLGRVTRIEQTDGAPSSGEAVADKRIDLAYNADGTFDAIDRYEDLSATDLVATSTYGYDNGGRLTSLDHDKGATSLAAYTWTYDAGSRITQFTSDDGTADYTYDNTGQLTATDFDFQTDESYEYDENGNRTNTGYTTGDNNQLESDGTYDYEYDAEGNRTKRTEISSGDYADYEWDHRNRLVAVEFRDSLDALQTRVTYAYDPFDRLIERTVDDDGDSTVDEVQRFIHHGGNIVLVFDASDNLTTRLLHGPAVDQLLAQEDVTAGETYWTLADNQQTVRDVADYDATLDETTVVNHLTYGAFGEITSESDSTYSPFQSFTGRIFDAMTGLSWYRARWYDAAVGRFLSEDPLGLAPDTNPNRYVNNSPANFVDPDGLDFVSVENGAVYWQVEEDGFWHDVNVGEAFAISSLHGDTINVYGHFGGGTVSYVALQEAADNFWDYYADMSGVPIATQHQVVQGLLGSLGAGHHFNPNDDTVWNALGTGFDHGAAIAANAWTLHQIDDLDWYVDHLVEENGGAYGFANVMVNIGTAAGYAALGVGLYQVAAPALTSASQWTYANASTWLTNTAAPTALTSGMVAAANQQYPRLARFASQWHHTWPRYLGNPPAAFWNLFGGRAEVQLPAAYHQWITNAIRQVFPFGQVPPNPARVWRELLQIYRDFPIDGFPYR